MASKREKHGSDQVQNDREPKDFGDRVAFGFVKALRFVADRFFAERYGHRAVVLETVAAVPGMVGGLLQHLKALRHIRDDDGWIRELLDEAENERMHLMTFGHIAPPTVFEQFVISSKRWLKTSNRSSEPVFESGGVLAEPKGIDGFRRMSDKELGQTNALQSRPAQFVDTGSREPSHSHTT